MPNWAMDISSGCSSPADTGSQLLFQPQMEPGTRHSVTVPGPIRQWGVSGCDGDGVDAVVVLGALPSECRARWQGPQMALHPRAGWQGPQCPQNPGKGTPIAPCPRTWWQGPQNVSVSQGRVAGQDHGALRYPHAPGQGGRAPRYPCTPGHVHVPRRGKLSPKRL